ncbi:MAG: efflux RND transporter periplasmic adaptor subunit [Elusimicrobiaceae bacterium]|nr:efflux RND transporter periplasmic adaptor subunit [Elusimicrobiaceae bacterium]
MNMNYYKKERRKRILTQGGGILLILFIGALIGAAIMAYKAKKGIEQMMAAMNKETYITVQTPKLENVTSNKKYIAKVEAINAVDIKPQVSGYIEEILFEDGSEVQEGQSLYNIEKRRYAANVASAKANLMQIENDYKRQQALYKDKMLPKAELEVAEANVAKAKAALDLAEVDLDHADVRAPISGRIGKTLVSKGNFVASGGANLARIVQTQPVRINISVTDKERLNAAKEMAKGPNESKMHLQAQLADGTIIDIEPNKVYVDNEVSAQTATIPLYIEYQNTENLLIPGNFINVMVAATSAKEEITVPQVAVAQDGNGKYVMVIKNDVAEQRYVEIGDTFKDRFVVKNGITTNDKIAITGVQKLSNGQKVKATEALE